MSVGFPTDDDAERAGAPPSFVVLGRILLLLVAAVALVSGVVLARAHDRAVTASVDCYVCPMHPQVVSSTPGDCPICGMALVRVTKFARGPVSMTEKADGVVRVERRVFAEQVRAAAWLGTDGVGTAVLYDDDLVGLEPDQHALFFGGGAPNMGIDAHLLPEPPSAVDSSTVRVRFRLDPDGGALAPPRGSRDVGSLQIPSCRASSWSSPRAPCCIQRKVLTCSRLRKGTTPSPGGAWRLAESSTRDTSAAAPGRWAPSSSCRVSTKVSR